MPYKSEFKGRKWKVGMLETCCVAPLQCCQSCFCPCCTAYQQRSILIGEGDYFCCARMVRISVCSLPAVLINLMRAPTYSRPSKFLLCVSCCTCCCV